MSTSALVLQSVEHQHDSLRCRTTDCLRATAAVTEAHVERMLSRYLLYEFRLGRFLIDLTILLSGGAS